MICLSMDDIPYLVFVLVILKVLFVLFKEFIWYSFLAFKLGYGVKWRTGDEVWAVITGATDGIGLEYARQLGLIGYNLVLISRNSDKLNATAKNLKNNMKENQKIKTICFDFNKTDFYDVIADELIELEEIFVLVNNVGTIYSIPEFYHRMPKSFIKSCLNVNLISAAKMIDIVLPKMLVQKNGVIICMSSQVGQQTFPLYTPYSAAKAYVSQMSKSLKFEYESRGIIFQCVVPNQVKTKLISNVEMPFVAIDVKEYVSSAIKTVGIEDCTPGHWKHRIIAVFERFGEFVIGERLVAKIIFIALSRFRQKFYKYNNITDDY